jgi:hypothetical protein
MPFVRRSGYWDADWACCRGRLDYRHRPRRWCRSVDLGLDEFPGGCELFRKRTHGQALSRDRPGNFVGTTMIPEALRPTSIEPFQISPSTVVGVPKTLPTFATWRGPSIPNTYGGKVVLEFAGEPLFAELVILRHFQREGWQGAWIDTYRRRTLSGIDQVSEIPPGPRARLTAISGHAGSSSGCFDVYVWRGDTFMFAEAKRLGRDRVRTSQVRWLRSALAVGVPLEALLVVEWSTSPHAVRGSDRIPRR